MLYTLNSSEERLIKIARDKRVTLRAAERILREMELTETAGFKKIISILLLRGWN